MLAWDLQMSGGMVSRGGDGRDGVAGFHTEARRTRRGGRKLGLRHTSCDGDMRTVFVCAPAHGVCGLPKAMELLG